MPAILDEANAEQREAIKTTEGPLLIIAGPGTGKTRTLVARTIYLLKEKKVDPSQIMIATFARKAAKELITRISKALIDEKLDDEVDINAMYIGTFHSICHRLIEENIEDARLGRNFRLFDDFEEKYFIYKKMDNKDNRFDDLEHFEQLPSANWNKLNGKWDYASAICGHASFLDEELINPDDLLKDDDPVIKAIGETTKRYHELMDGENALSYSGIQLEAYRLLAENKEIRTRIQKGIRYLMVDEYQDTDYIQEQLALLIAAPQFNICVVGDDDQGLYRFRGATIRNILAFPEHVKEVSDKPCKVVKLLVNYRSTQPIVDFSHDWMESTSNSEFDFSWGVQPRYRYEKDIRLPDPDAGKPARTQLPVLRITGNGYADAWHERIRGFIERLLAEGVIRDPNQVAFLFNSIKSEQATALATYLERHGISVYAPRSGSFFEREEVLQMWGCLVELFPSAKEKMEKRENKSSEFYAGYIRALEAAARLRAAHPELDKWISTRASQHADLREDTDYAFAEMLYEMVSFKPFNEILDIDLDSGISEQRPLRNVARFVNLIAQFDRLNALSVLTPKNLQNEVWSLFCDYLPRLFNEGLFEYEDEEEYLPSGSVAFLTVHQAKGMEFPVVIVGGLDRDGWHLNKKNYKKNYEENYEERREAIREKYAHRKSYEPDDAIPYFDFWRKYYTAFTRAQDILVLSSLESKPNMPFRNLYRGLREYTGERFDFKGLEASEIKETRIRHTYSFTSDVSYYDNCSLQYKFYRVLGFPAAQGEGTFFGTLLHESIEDLHRAIMSGSAPCVTEEQIDGWVDANYRSLFLSENVALSSRQIEAVKKQVKGYYADRKITRDDIEDVEVEITQPFDDYFIKGTVDLLRTDGDTVDIVDFKSGKKPDESDTGGYREKYRRQLMVYADLVKHKTGRDVSKVQLYFTGGNPGDSVLEFPCDDACVEATKEEFDMTVKKIQEKKFSERAEDAQFCDGCDFRGYCRRNDKADAVLKMHGSRRTERPRTGTRMLEAWYAEDPAIRKALGTTQALNNVLVSLGLLRRNSKGVEPTDRGKGMGIICKKGTGENGDYLYPLYPVEAGERVKEVLREKGKI